MVQCLGYYSESMIILNFCVMFTVEISLFPVSMVSLRYLCNVVIQHTSVHIGHHPAILLKKFAKSLIPQAWCVVQTIHRIK